MIFLDTQPCLSVPTFVYYPAKGASQPDSGNTTEAGRESCLTLVTWHHPGTVKFSPDTCVRESNSESAEYLSKLLNTIEVCQVSCKCN